MSACLRSIRLLALVPALLALSGCNDSPSTQTPGTPPQTSEERLRDEHLFAQYQAALHLAEKAEPYMVINLQNDHLELCLGAATVWQTAIRINPADSAQFNAFIDQFRGDETCLIRILEDNYLYSARVQVPESVLAIISEATNFSPDLMRRQVPEQFSLRWDCDATIHVRTGLDSAQDFSLRNAIHDIRASLANPFGKASITLSIPPEDAITLYRAARPGLPTLIRPAG